MSDEATRYFARVRELIETVPLEPVDATQLRMPVLGVAGEADPQAPTALYQQLRQIGAPIRIQEIAGAGHGTCFSDARFRKAAVDFLAASAAISGQAFAAELRSDGAPQRL